MVFPMPSQPIVDHFDIHSFINNTLFYFHSFIIIHKLIHELLRFPLWYRQF
jgi:hypothetical protein